MPLMPKRVKWRKSQRGTVKGVATRGNTLAFGEYGVQALDRGWITAQQIESAFSLRERADLVALHHL